MSITKIKKQKIISDLNFFAFESVNVEFQGDTVFAFGTELAILRLAYRYRNSKNVIVTAGHSKDLGHWAFSFDVGAE